MEFYEAYLVKKLEDRKSTGTYRELFVPEGLVDFCSNDYLGFARDPSLKKSVEQEYILQAQTGSTGSRLISGNTKYAEDLEAFLAEFYLVESTLIFNSGYDANLGLLSALPYKNDLVLYDELSHASIIDGINLGKSQSIRFRHNDLADLEKKLSVEAERKYIVVESVYSMDGDFAPLTKMAALAKKYNAALIVDEAHATGLFGRKKENDLNDHGGQGRVVALRLEKEVFARVHTFGKAMGVHGAIVVGSEKLIQFLTNYARSFIYTTGLPIHTHISIKKAHDKLSSFNYNENKISGLITLFRLKVEELGIKGFLESYSPIQSIVVPGNEKVKRISEGLKKEGFYAKAIVSPTVPKGKERIRICLHAFNIEDEIDGLLKSLKRQLNELG